MDSITLTGPEVKPASGAKPESIIVLLHGLGSDGQDLISLAPFFAAQFPKTHFIAPNAPYACDMAPMGHQWFSLREWSPQTMLKGAHEAAPALDLFLDMQLQRFGLPDSKLGLIGFSQGTMMSLYVALRRPKSCGAVVGFSGAMIGEEGIVAKPPVCLIHGREDTVVPFGAMALAEAVLKKHDIPVEAHARMDLGHSIDPGGIAIATQFLKKHLA